jgi:cytosine/uracil/thiamine/allantoin permease
MTISASMFGAAPGPMFGIVASDYYLVRRQRLARRAFGENAINGRAARRTD